MANALYPKWKEAVMQASANSALNGSGTTGLYAVLVDSGAVAYNSAHQFYSDIASGVVGTEVEITSKTFANGVLDGADLTFPNVSGATVEAIALYIKNAGANSTWRLFAWLDTNITGLPFTPNGGNANLAWNASGILAL